MRAACPVSVHREIDQNMVKAFAEARLLHRQIAAQPVAIRMAFAGRVMAVPIGGRVVIVVATSIRCGRGERAAAGVCIVLIMPATSKHCMDEQRSTQQTTKNGTH